MNIYVILLYNEYICIILKFKKKYLFMFRTLFNIAMICIPFVCSFDNGYEYRYGDGDVIPYPPFPPYPCKYVNNVFNVKQPGVSCPYFDPFLQSYHYGPVVAADVFYHNYDQFVKQSVHHRQTYMNEQLKFNHDVQNMYLNNEYDFYKQSPWGFPPGFEFYYQNQKDWIKYTQTVEHNQLNYFQNQENKYLGLHSVKDNTHSNP